MKPPPPQGRRRDARPIRRPQPEGPSLLPEGMRLIAGLQPVREAVRAIEQGTLGDRTALGLRILMEESDSPQLEALARFARDHGIAVERVPRSDLDRTARGVRHQGVLAIAPPLEIIPLDKLHVGPESIILALDELQDPQNFGAVIRSAVALGAESIIWPEHSSAPLSPATFRASAGAVEHATLCRVPGLPGALTDLAARGLAVIGLDPQADEQLQNASFDLPLVLVVGAEGKGLRKTVKQACTRLLRLPMRNVASLNASVAIAIALYEVTRNRTTAPL
jgi:23S rRNA (guanosine2251-2'-O)-methyltransferase